MRGVSVVSRLALQGGELAEDIVDEKAIFLLVGHIPVDFKVNLAFVDIVEQVRKLRLGLHVVPHLSLAFLLSVRVRIEGRVQRSRVLFHR